MSLNYLEFDYSEDTEGVGTYEAMASVSAKQVSAVQAEVAQVLAWASHAFPDCRGPLDEGFAWDHDLQTQMESSTLNPEQESWHTVTLSLSGTQAFCQALRERFDLG